MKAVQISDFLKVLPLNKETRRSTMMLVLHHMEVGMNLFITRREWFLDLGYHSGSPTAVTKHHFKSGHRFGVVPYEEGWVITRTE